MAIAQGWFWLISTLALLHCCVGLIAAKVAHGKGHDLSKWLVWGLIGGTPTLIAACLCTAKPSPVDAAEK